MNWRLFIKGFYFFPNANYTITTNKSITQILEIVSQETDFVDEFSKGGSSLSNKRFEGYLTEKGFQIKRLLSFGHSSFLPLITGEIEVVDIGKSRVNVNVKYPLKVNYFLIFFCVFSLILIIGSPRIGIGIPMYIVVMVIYNYELRVSGDYLSRVFTEK